jgi:hypothetical protein
MPPVQKDPRETFENIVLKFLYLELFDKDKRSKAEEYLFIEIEEELEARGVEVNV